MYVTKTDVGKRLIVLRFKIIYLTMYDLVFLASGYKTNRAWSNGGVKCVCKSKYMVFCVSYFEDRNRLTSALVVAQSVLGLPHPTGQSGPH